MFNCKTGHPVHFKTRGAQTLGTKQVLTLNMQKNNDRSRKREKDFLARKVSFRNHFLTYFFQSKP